MIFDSSSKPDRVASIPFANNTFIVMVTTPRGSVEKGLGQLGRVLQDRHLPPLPAGTPNFRLMIHLDGKLRSVDQRARVALERTIAAKTGGRVEARGMCQEYWIIGRSELSDLLLCARLPKPKRPQKVKGAISYELASMLVSASHPHPRDVFLDPFAGSGSFVAARQDMPAHQIFHSDTNRQFRKDLPRKMIDDKRVSLLTEDVRSRRCRVI